MQEYFLSVCVCVYVCGFVCSTQSFVYGIMCGNISAFARIFVCMYLSEFSRALVRCVSVCVCVSVRERHALCTLTTSQSVCRGVMDTAVARPLKSNLHSFA